MSDQPKKITFLAKPESLISFEDWAEYLFALFTGPCRIDEDAISGKLSFIITFGVIEDQIEGMKIEIYPKEEGIPHFHVRCQGTTAKFSIKDSAFLDGNLPEKMVRKVKFWYVQEGVKNLLVEKWNSTRPTNCTVGIYRE